MSASTQIWNRLEPRPRTNSFKRSLRAEVRDALWMISRQWQLGEFNADDTGTAAFARLDMQTSRVTRIAKKNDNYVPINDTMPLECLVEREPLVPDLMLRVELGRQFMKMLQKELVDIGVTGTPLDTALDDVRNSVSLQFKIPGVPPGNNNPNYPDFYSSPELWQATLSISDGRAVDGYEIVKPGASAITTLITFTNSTGAMVTALTTAKTAFEAWFSATYSQPGTPGTEDYWLHNYLEYQFACASPKNSSDYTILAAREYYHGHLDWYSFNIQSDTQAFASLTEGTLEDVIEQKPFTVIPSKISFGGMPAPRYWEMEDRRVDFGNIKASTTDTATLLVGEFALLYSNDWTLLPYTVPTGSILNLRKVLVTDVFGQVTLIESGCDNDWHMYTHTTEGSDVCNPRIFIAPVVQSLEESEKIESVTFMRDEMANMVWAVETTISDGVSGSQPAREAGQRLVAFLEEETTPVNPPNSVTNNAEIKYNIMSRIPENWIPFVPVNRGPVSNAPNIQLQRAAMPRQILNNLPSGRVRPRTSLLWADANPLTNTWPASFIYEEEIPRSGAILSMTWQRARWHNGHLALWLGRRKQNGRGEANSGLRFDYLAEKV